MIFKRLGKTFLSLVFEAQVKKLRIRNDFKVVAVVGSVGKTTTKLAIVKMLQPNIRLQHQNGNYNDRLTVPLVLFGQEEPGIYDVWQWFKIWHANKKLLRAPYPYDLVVLELGTDGPGQLQKMAYVQPDIVVVTALTDEHMEYFKTLDAVAVEELSAVSFSKQALVNIDDSPAKFLQNMSYLSYGFNASDYRLTNSSLGSQGQQLSVVYKNQEVHVTTALLGLPGAKATLAAIAVADLLGLSREQILSNVAHITSVAGRMQLLAGLQNSTIIDDSYNASPVAMRSALDVLYGMPATQRIAVLGNMNEMGELSPDMHREIGNYCDPSKLAFVVTIGPDANKYLAPTAAGCGCMVKTCDSPYEAGEFVKQQLKSGAVVLVKGSQNGVFSEETVKLLLADLADSAKLVRQSSFWLAKKQRQFGN